MSKRKTFVFPAEASQRLERIRAMCRVLSATDVVRLALLVLEEQLMVIASGGTIFIQNKDGSSRTYNPLFEPEKLNPGGDRQRVQTDGQFQRELAA